MRLVLELLLGWVRSGTEAEVPWRWVRLRVSRRMLKEIATIAKRRDRVPQQVLEALLHSGLKAVLSHERREGQEAPQGRGRDYPGYL